MERIVGEGMPGKCPAGARQCLAVPGIIEQMPAPTRFPRSHIVALTLLFAACTPALNWRDVRPEDSGLLMQFPCRPDQQTRTLPLAGAPVQLSLLACAASKLTWGLAHTDVGDAARVETALAALAAAAAANLGATPAVAQSQAIAGASSPGRRLKLQGRLPDGAAVQMQLILFTRGTHVFQATVLGEQVPDEAAQTYFESLRLAP